MTDKGGKGYSGKSALKSTAGKDGNSAKSKKGKSVQFETEEDNTPNSNGRVDTPAAKGGKGDKAANGAKKSTSKAATPAEGRIEQEIPSYSTCLMDCEAAEILQGIQDQMVFLSKDPDIKIPVAFDMGLAYAKRHGNPVKPQTVRNILEPLKKHGVTDVEVCLIANASPESVDEALNLVPSLKPKASSVKEPLRIALDELANVKQALANLKDSNKD